MTTDGSSPRRRRSIEDLVAIADQDPGAFGELLEQYREFLRAEARRHLPPGTDPAVSDSDLVQDAYLAACHAYGVFRDEPDGKLAAVLRVIVRNKARNRARSARSAVTRVDLPSDLPDSRQEPPDEALANAERDAAVRERMGSLSSEHLAVLELRFRDRLSFGEIGRRLGRSADAARKLFARAVDAVRRRLPGVER